MCNALKDSCWTHHDDYGWDDSEYCLTVLEGLQTYLRDRGWIPRKKQSSERENDDDAPLFRQQRPPSRKFGRKSTEELLLSREGV